MGVDNKKFRSVAPLDATWQNPFIKQLSPLEHPSDPVEPKYHTAGDGIRASESPITETSSSSAPAIQPDVAAVLEKSGALGKPSHGESGRRKKEQVQSHLPI